MRTLRNHTLVYDDECPMCDLYTKGFVKTGMLDKNGRVEYGCARVPVTFNNERARNEIALIDYETGTVSYGIDSLVKVVGHSFPFVNRVVNCKLIRSLLSILYSFISYNRKVIAPSQSFERKGSCTPTYHTGYRIAYIIFIWLKTSLILTAYTRLISPSLVPISSFYRESLICGGQIFFQLVIVRLLTRDKVLHYIGNMMTVSAIGALLLLPVIILCQFIPGASAIALPWFCAVVCYMLLVHSRRVRMLGLSPWLTVSWICYRLIVLCIILI